MIRSLRTRLTAWYLGFFSVLFVLFALAFYGVLACSLEQRLDNSLAAEAGIAVRLFREEVRETNGDAFKAAAETVASMRASGDTVAVLSDNRVLAATGQLPDTELKALAARGGPITRNRQTHAAVQVTSIGGQDFAILACGPVAPIEASLEAVRQALLIGVPLLLLAAGVGGFLLAGRSVAPIGSMAEQARRISDSNLEARLDVGDAAEELKLLAASFNELLSRLNRSFEGMRRFVADASHELRTPLSVIRGEADVALSQERTAGEYRESLSVVLDESRRLSRLIDDLLNLARADSGRVKLHLGNVYVDELLEDCCRSLKPLAAARKIKLECRSGADVPFRGDEQLLRRMVLNLLDNALRYAPEGGRVEASVETGDQYIRLRVHDNGPGIPPDAAPHVFERFYRADRARSRGDGGFGLGLSIVKWIAETHHGAVKLDTAPDAGTTFTVTLPR